MQSTNNHENIENRTVEIYSVRGTIVLKGANGQDIPPAGIHSSEYNVGYGGSGPAELALAVTEELLGSRDGYQRVKWAIIARIGRKHLPVRITTSALVRAIKGGM